MDFVKISELPMVNETVLPLTAGDVMPIVHGPTTYQVQLSNLQNYFNINVQLSAAGTSNQVIVNQNGQLSAFPGFVYLPSLSGLQVGYDNILTGQYSSILGGAQNTNDRVNTHILGSGIQAALDNYTLVNNISALGILRGGNQGTSVEWYEGFTFANANSARLGMPELNNRYAQLSGSTFTGNVNVSGNLTLGSNVSALNGLTVFENLNVNGVVETLVRPTITSSAVTLDLSDATTFTVRLTSNVSNFVITNFPVNQNKTTSFFLVIIQDDNGGRTVSWNFGYNINWPGGNVPTVTSAAYAIDVFSFIWNDVVGGWLAFPCGQNFIES